MRAKLVKRGSLLSLIAVFVLTSVARAEHPPAPKLLPQKTLAYLRISSVPDLTKGFNKTAFGRLFKDPKIRPLIGDLYKTGAEAFKRVEQRIGLSLDQLLRIPQGELAIALVAPESGNMALVGILEVGKSSANANKLLKQMAGGLATGGYKTSTQKAGNIKLTIHNKPDAGFFKDLVLFERDKTIYFFTDVQLAKQTLKVWDGANLKTFSTNNNFVTIMKKSLGTKEERPQVTFFVDPIEIVRVVGQDNFGVQVALSFFPRLGLDGLKGIGGSMIMGTEEFDSIMHLHILTEGKRKGILEMIALEPGEITPERFVPSDVASYMSVNWDLKKTYRLVAQAIDSFQGKGTTAESLQKNVSKNLGVDVEKEILGQLGKRFTMMQHVVQPGVVNGTSMFLALEIQDGKKFKKTFDKILNKVAQNPNQIKQKRFGGVTTYQVDFPIPRNFNEQLMRKPEVVVAIMNNYFVFSDSMKFMRHVIRRNSGQGKNLADELDFKLIQQQIGRQIKTKPAMIIFSRPGPVLKGFYDLAAKEERRKAWTQPRREGAQQNRVIGILDKALTDNPLPPFKTIEKYLTTAGALISVDDTGFHYTAFSLKRE